MAKKAAARRRAKGRSNAVLDARRRELAQLRATNDHQRKVERLARGLERQIDRASHAMSALMLSYARRTGSRIFAPGETATSDYVVDEIMRQRDELEAENAALKRELAEERERDIEEPAGNRLTLDESAATV